MNSKNAVLPSLFVLMLSTVVSCRQKSNSGYIQPVDSSSLSPYSKIETYIGVAHDTNTTSCTPTVCSRDFADTFLVYYLKGDTLLDIRGVLYSVNGCDTPGTIATSFERKQKIAIGGVYTYTASQYNEVTTLRSDSLFVDVAQLKFENALHFLFQGKLH